MSTDLTVEGIVAQIRKRIAEESAQGSKHQPLNGFSVAIPTQSYYRERMAEDSRRFADLEMQIEAATAHIGGKPPVPPTWRGRFGSWVIDILRRMFWWYAAPIQETIDLLNRRNREQAARHQHIQDQILSLIGGLQQVLNRTDALEASGREMTGWQDENRVSRQEIRRQLKEMAGRQHENRTAQQKIQRQLEEVAGWHSENRALGQQVKRQMEEIAAWQNESRASGQVVQQQLEELVNGQTESRVSEQVVQLQLRELESRQSDAQTQVAALAQQMSKSDLGPVTERLTHKVEELLQAQTQREQNHRGQIDELKAHIQELRASGAAADIHRAELAQRVAEAAHTAGSRLPGLEAQLRAEAGAREALATGLNSHVERREESLRVQIEELKESLQELRVSSAASEFHRAELEQRLTDSAQSTTGRLVLETQLHAETGAREALAMETTGHVERLGQDFREQIDELKGGLQELRVSSAAADFHRADLEQRVSDAIGTAWGKLPVLETQLHVEAEAREVLAAEINSHVARLEQKINEGIVGVAGRASNLALTQQKQGSELRIQEHRIAMFLREVRNRLPKSLTETQVRQMTEDAESRIAAVYAEFEDVFRGPRDEIKERLKVYLPRLTQAKAGSPKAPVLDLGCGRGELLELLSEHKLSGRGVDSNPIMIGRCQDLGLEVVRGEALEYLRSLPDKSLGAITSFHMIEHMPFETVLAIVDEALRVLQSGGLLILETPNPQNALVGSQTFWIDPTHLRPIPSQTLRFFVEARGFCQVEILNLQPYSEAVRVPEDCGAVAQRFNEYFYGAQDYSVIGLRP